jgi:steroid delta-isomerase-like uncharacterized protein
MSRQESSIAAGTPAQGGHMTRDEVVAFFDRRQAAWENLDAAALAADYADHCVVDSPAGGTHTGRDSVQSVLEAVFGAFLDQKLSTDQLLVDGDHVAQVLSIEGTNMGGFLGLAPSGKRFRISAVFVYELKNRQIVRERRIYDFTGMLTQIGVLKTKPV